MGQLITKWLKEWYSNRYYNRSWSLVLAVLIAIGVIIGFGLVAFTIWLATAGMWVPVAVVGFIALVGFIYWVIEEM